MLRVESTFILSMIFFHREYQLKTYSLILQNIKVKMSLHNDGDGIMSDALEEDFQTLSTDWEARLCNCLPSIMDPLLDWVSMSGQV